MLEAGLQWPLLPLARGGGSGSTCWRRRRDWQAAGVWHALHRALLDKLGGADRRDWSRVCVGSASVPAQRLYGGKPRWDSVNCAPRIAAVPDEGECDGPP